MHQVDNVLISDEVFSTKFACDLSRCRGKCCQYGDLGAPISEDEIETIRRNLQQVSTMLPENQVKFLEAGISETYKGSLHIREIGPNLPCPLSYTRNKIVFCSLHSLAISNKVPLLELKPLWCSLFPLTIKKSGELWLINLHTADFCVSEKDAPPVLLSFADLLTCIFGSEWFAKVKALY